MTTTTTFSVTYEIPVSPERLAQLEDEISRVADSEDAESRLARLANQMLPEKRTESARQVVCGRLTEWFCPKCDGCIAVLEGRCLAEHSECPSCGASVRKEELPMPLDLYRMRTRRNDGVEIQVKPHEVIK